LQYKNKKQEQAFLQSYPSRIGDLEDVGCLSSGAVVSRLVALGAFVYVYEAASGDGGQVSVRLETKKRGSEVGYWFAYKRHADRLYKTYICEAFALVPHNLDSAAARLFALLP